jgi:phosphoglycolate phosphatase-like HAD superfamily hydrolase
VKAVAIDLDGALADTRPLWDAWLEASAGVLGVPPGELPADRREAAVELDRRGAGNWRTLLARFAEDRAPVFLRREAGVSAAVRAVLSSGRPVTVVTDAPDELARIALAHLGLGELPLGQADTVLRTRAELLDYASTPAS